jgi:hypothetical protein
MPRTKLGSAVKRPRPPKTPLERQNAIIEAAMPGAGFRTHRQLAKYLGITEQRLSKCFHGSVPWRKYYYELREGLRLDNDTFAKLVQETK